MAEWLWLGLVLVKWLGYWLQLLERLDLDSSSLAVETPGLARFGRSLAVETPGLARFGRSLAVETPGLARFGLA
jgi:hypothetical protein